MAALQDSRTVDLDQRFSAAREVRRVFENDWVLTLAFMLGNQWIKVDSSGRIFNVGLDDDRVMITDNRMRPAVRTNIARMTKSNPTWQGVPKDRSDEEIQRARLREAVFEHYWRVLQMRRRFRLALWYREGCGMAFLKTTWDPTAGDKMTVMAARGNGPVIADNYGRPLTPDRMRAVAPQLNDQQRGQVNELLEERAITLGDVTVQLKTPFEVVVDPLATDEGLTTAEYVCEEALYSPSYLRERFNYDGPLEEEGNSAGGTVEAHFPGQNAYLERSRERRGAPGRRGVRVREYWSLAGLDGPRAKHSVWLPNGEQIFEEDSKYPWLPYTDFPGLGGRPFLGGRAAEGLDLPAGRAQQGQEPDRRERRAVRQPGPPDLSRVARPRRQPLAGPPGRGDHLSRSRHARLRPVLSAGARNARVCDRAARGEPAVDRDDH
jgi:hypothetical protein